MNPASYTRRFNPIARIRATRQLFATLSRAIPDRKGRALNDSKTQAKWLWIAGATVVVIGLVVLVIALLSNDHNPHSSPKQPTAAEPTSTAPPLHQAKWRVHTFPRGIANHVSKRNRRTAERQGARAARGIKAVYNAVFLDPSVANRAVRAHFESGAARAFLRAGTGPPRRTQRVQITFRAMHIGVETGRSRRAIATVTVYMKGSRRSNRIKIKHESTLWLERVDRDWKVLAFRAHQHPR